jgi:hypothetical protein
MPRATTGIHRFVFPDERSRIIAAAQSILDQGGWCVLKACVDVPRQRWEPRILVFDPVAEAVADAVEEEIAREPQLDARLIGCDRRTLQRDPSMGAYLCYMTDAPAPSTAAAPAQPRPRTATRRTTMQVRDGMNPVVVTVGPNHTLREAARRMTARGVGAAVIIDDELPGPLHHHRARHPALKGVGQSIDGELVRDHLTSEVVCAAADWSLERAAAAMVRAGSATSL